MKIIYGPRQVRFLLSALALSLAGGLKSLAWAQQSVCGENTTTLIRVENSTGALTLEAAVNCTDGGLVEAIWAGAVTLDAPISVGAGTFLSVTGEGASAEVGGGFQTRLFYVAPLGGLNLTVVKLSNGTAVNGGAIYSDTATLTLDSCVFEGNAATGGDGGAVWATGGNLTIVGGEFSKNTASLYGGAVFTTDTDLAIRESTRFEDNEAFSGGALYCEADSVGTTLVSCSVSETAFVSNFAFGEAALDSEDDEVSWAFEGGGAAAFSRAVVNITDSNFSSNAALLSGGAIFGASDTTMTINGCTFYNNTTPESGGAIVASSAQLGGSTLLTNNSATTNGGAVFGWDSSGVIEFSDIICKDNVATENGGCFHTAGEGTVNKETVMQGNVAKRGGCIYADGGGNITVHGGEFTTCQCTENGAFLFASNGARVNITGGLVENNLADKRGAVAYCSGNNDGEEGSMVTIEGGTFRDNSALELGGAIVAWGSTTLITITGGLFANNSARFYGGFIFVEEEASLLCERAIIQENYAGDQGGGIFAQDATWVNSSCDLIGNESPQGAAAYLTYVKGVLFESLSVSDNLASGGSVVYVAESSVVARDVTFETGVGLQDDSSNRAIQLEGTSTLFVEECLFAGWLGDTVIYNKNSEAGSLVLESCDFRGSSAAMVVLSPYSDAEIRNAVIGDLTLENAVSIDGSLSLVDQALYCEDSNACSAAGVCVDSTLGVLCECIEGGSCLDGGGAISLGLKTSPDTVTYSPDLVSFELVVSAAADGTTHVIWELTFEADELALEVVPSSGFLPPGLNVTVTVTGSALEQDVGGNLTSRFVVTSVGEGSSDSATGVELEVGSMFYLCEAFAYAMPLNDTDANIECEQCATIEGAEGVDCDLPGATLASLPVRAGYWRSSQESLVVHSCLHSDACSGATEVSSSDDYCADGYKGPYCAVCTEGYGAGVGHTCHSCENTKSRLLIAVGALFSVLSLLLLFVAVVFLIGGLDAVYVVRQTLPRPFAKPRNAPTSAHSVFEARVPKRVVSARNTGMIRADGALPPVLDMPSEVKGEAGGDVTTHTRLSAVNSSGVNATEGTSRRSSESGVGVGVGMLDATNRDSVLHAETPASHNVRPCVVTGAAGVEATDKGEGAGAGGSGRSGRCGLWVKIKLWTLRLPLDKLKILVVVWQILTVFPSITGVDFPTSYSRFLSWVGVVNLDIGNIFSASCLVPSFTFYQRLLTMTLAPILLAIVLGLTYHVAKKRAGIGAAGVIARRAAWSRHMAAGLLLTFMVFTSASTVVFKTFACDGEAVEGKSYLREDYRLSCKSDTHMAFMVYAGLMMVVYPIGIPILYAFILWSNRESLNPRIKVSVAPERDGAHNAAVGAGAANAPSQEYITSDAALRGQAGIHLSPKELEDLEEKIRLRTENPDLVPSMFLWKDFGPDLYYYEVIECGRRILLTSVLIFIAPHSTAQAAMACLFAFGSLLGFELLRPHLDPADSWLYRLGCVVIFLSNFLALLIKVDAAGEGNGSTLGVLLIAINVLLVLAVLSASWFSTQQSVDDSREDENALTLAKTMLTAEQHAAKSARVSREGGSNMSSVSSSVGPGAELSLRAALDTCSQTPRRWRGEGAMPSDAKWGAKQGKGRGEDVSAAMVEELWKEDKVKARPYAEEWA